MKTTLITFVLLILFAGCSNKSTTDQTINVMGYSQLKVNPDLSIITLNAAGISDNKSAVVSEINRMVDSVLTQIEAKDIKVNERVINNLNIYWNYIYGKDRARSIEYNARQTIEIKMNFDINEVEKLVEIVREIPRLDFSVGFDISKLRKDSVENVLSKMAIEDANRKSANIASAANLELVKILDITYQSDRPGAFMKAEMAFARGAADRINLEPRDIEMSDNIKVTYLVRNK